MKNRLVPFLVWLLCLSCGGPKTDTIKSSGLKKDTIQESASPEAMQEVTRETEYSISVHKIDSMHFFAARMNTRQVNKKPEKITDFKTAEKMLKGTVEFTPGDEEYHAIKSIRFKNGTRYIQDPSDACSFVAYYPAENILLCEGGHATDVSFNLTNGKQTEETGNPGVIVYSPQNQLRLNGHYGGQECYSYFVQKKINGEFRKTVQLDEAFQKITKRWLCTIEEPFWTNESTLYVAETNVDENGQHRDFYKITFHEK